MSIISIQYDAIKVAADHLELQRDLYVTLRSGLQDAILGLLETMQMDTGNAARDRFNEQVAPRLQRLIELSGRLSDDLKKAAETLDRADRAGAEKFGG